MNRDKEEAKKLIEALPDNASWDDIISAFYVKMRLLESLKAAKEGRTVPHNELKRRFSTH